MSRHTTWDDLDADVLGEVLDNPAVRLGEYIMNLRVSELFFAMACLLSMVLFVYAPHPPKQVCLSGAPFWPSLPSAFFLTAAAVIFSHDEALADLAEAHRQHVRCAQPTIGISIKTDDLGIRRNCVRCNCRGLAFAHLRKHSVSIRI